MYGPKEYAKISSTARRFIDSYKPTERPKIVEEEYKYISARTNLTTPKATEEVDKIHQYLGPSAITEDVQKEFGQKLDVVG